MTIFRSAIILLFLLYTSTVNAEQHSFTGLELDANGWTDLSQLVQTNSRIIYVSTSGNDDTGAYYASTDPLVSGSNSVFEPGAVAPYQTIAAGYAQLRDGYPDFLLLKRGDDFGSFNLEFNKSGESQTARIVIGAYGATSIARPTTGQINLNQNGVDYLIVADIQLDDEEIAMVGRGPVSHVLIEGCYFPPGPGGGIVIQDEQTTQQENIDYLALRRNVIAGRYRPSGDTAYVQGIFIDDSLNLLIEENVFDDNGHDELGAEMSAQDLRSHNTYIMLNYTSASRQQVWRGNISTRASSHCYQPGQGGTFYGNLAVECPIAIQTAREDSWFSGVSGTYEKNVILHGRDISSTNARGWGFVISNADGMTISDNIIADNTSSTTPTAFSISTQLRESTQMYVTNTTLSDNVVHAWDGSTVTDGEAFNLRGADGGYVSNITLTNNKVHLTNSDLRVIDAGPYQPITASSGNTFYATRTAAEQFYLGAAYDLDGYKTLVSDTTSTNTHTTASGAYGITDYLTSIGDTATLAAYYTALRAQRKGAWDTDYTALATINFVRDKFGKEAVSYSYSGLGLTNPLRAGQQPLRAGTTPIVVQ